MKARDMILLRGRTVRAELTLPMLAALMAAHDAAPSSFNYDDENPEDRKRWQRLVEALILAGQLEGEHVVWIVPDNDPGRGYESLFLGAIVLTGPRGFTPAARLFGTEPVDPADDDKKPADVVYLDPRRN